MEENKIETERPSQTPIVFPPRRRRHLNSGTYRTLVRIFSHFDESQHLVSDQNVPQELNRDNGNNESVQEAEKEVPENVELVGPDGAKGRVADECCNGNGFRERIEQIESLLSVEENEDFSGLEDTIGIENILAIDLKDMGYFPEQMLVDEPELVVKGNCEPSAASLDQNQNGGDKAALLTNEEEHVETVTSQDSVQMVSVSHGSSLKTVELTESLNPRESTEQKHSLSKTSALDVEPIMQLESMELQTPVSAEGAIELSIPITEVGAIKETEIFSQNVPEAFDFSLNKDMVAEASKPTDYSKDKSLLPETNSLEVVLEMPEKFKETEKPVCDITAMSSTNDTDDGDIEEGEISGDDGMDGRPRDELLQDTVVLGEQKVHKGQISKDVIDRKEQLCEEVNYKDFGSSSFLVDVVEDGKIGRGVELRESRRTDMVCRPGVVQGQNVSDSHPLLDGGRIEMKDNRVEMGIDWSGAGNHGTASEEKWDAGACNKRKRGPPNKEKKERKKAKERKKRAEKNRELGVKRLKLQPLQKPKPVAYCRHYLNGKCNLGDQCKYSHDTVPLTKSTPCGKFARNECMKGDDCGYDHDLSKYICHHFRDNGFCGRGDSCLFSHKMPSKEESETTACKPELKPPMVQSNSRSQQVNIGGASQQNVHALGFSTGIHSRNNTKQNVTENVLKKPELATKGISFPSVENSSLVHSSMSKQGGVTPDRNTGTKAGNQIDQSPFSSIQNSNEILKRTPVTTPKGINFLSFAKASPDAARGKSQVSHQTSPGVSETVQNSNGMLKSDKTAASLGTSFNPFGKCSVASPTGGQNLNAMLQVNLPAASHRTNFNPFGNSSLAGSGSDQNLKGIQPAESQGTSFNPFRKSSVTSSSSDQNLNGMLQNNQPAASQGTSFNPFGKSSVTSFSSDQNLRGILQAHQPSASQGTSLNPFEKSSVSSSSTVNPDSLTSCWGNGSNRDSRESQNTADKPQNSSAVSLRLPPSPLTSGQSSDHVASKFCKGTANSFQRGLFSTLAFAAKYRAQNMNQSIGSTDTQVDKGN
ncbi:hypothetical protein ACFX13_018294 [Malus domestica]